MSSVNAIIDQLKDNLEKNLDHTKIEFKRIRAGKASPDMLDGVFVEYYGASTPISQVANVNTPDARSINIQPWDKSLINAIEKAIINSNLGFAPQNDGEYIRINLPPITDERRKELVKRAKAESESSKVGIRNLRKDANEKIRKLKADGVSEDEMAAGEDRVQKLIDSFIAKTEELLVDKEKEIMTV
jgi:ribosome recycling factor